LRRSLDQIAETAELPLRIDSSGVLDVAGIVVSCIGAADRATAARSFFKLMRARASSRAGTAVLVSSAARTGGTSTS